MFTAAQQAAARRAFDACGYGEALHTLPLDSGNEVSFVLSQEDLLKLDDPVALERMLGEILSRKVWLLSSVGDRTERFDQASEPR